MDLLIIFAIGFGSSLLGSFASGTTSLLSLTGLLSLGILPYNALAIHRFGLFGFDLGGLYEYTKKGKVNWNMALGLCLVGVPSAILGATIILSVDQSLLKQVLGWFILLFIPIALVRPKLGVRKTVVSKTKKMGGYIAYFFTTTWGSSFNIGVGIFHLYTMMYFFGNTITEAKANNKIPGLLKNTIVIIVFLIAGYVNLLYGMVYFLGMFLGATLATKVILKIGDEWLRRILLVTIFVLAVKLVFGY